MNAVPISVNAAPSGNASGGASVQASKATTLPAFAQVMAEKQAAVSAPQENRPASGAGKNSEASASGNAAAPKSPEPTAVNPKSGDGGTSDTARKSDTKGKSANDPDTSKNAAQVQAQIPAQVPPPAIAQIPVVIPGLNEAMPWLAPAGDPASAAAKTAGPANGGAANLPAAAAMPTDATGANPGTTNTATADVASTQPQAPATSELTGPIAADLQNLPASVTVARAAPATETVAGSISTPAGEAAGASGATPAIGTDPMAGQKNAAAPAPVETATTASTTIAEAAVAAQPLPVAGTNAAVSNAVGNSGNASASQTGAATSAAKQQDLSAATATTSDAKPGDLSAAAAAAVPAATADAGAAKTEVAPKIQGKRAVLEVLRSAAALAEKEAQAVARVSVNAANDVVGAIKGKSGAGDNAAAITSQPAAGAKNETPASVTAEAVAPVVAERPVKLGSAKSGSNVKGNASTDGSANGGSSAGGATNSSGSTETLDAIATHSSVAAGQSVPSNLATNMANAIPGPSATIGRELGSAMSVKAGAASNNGAAAVPDADDAVPQPNESRVVNVAQLTGDQGHSQVRIAMQADQLGQVELHATVRGQQVGAAITVEKKEAHAAMAAEMPSLQQALEERQFRVGEVVLMQGTLHSTAGDAGNAAAEQQRRGQAGTTYQQVENETMYEAGAGTSFEGSGIFDDSGRLSVRA